jgi:hypothetical protein
MYLDKDRAYHNDKEWLIGDLGLQIFRNDNMCSLGYIRVGECQITYDLPDDFDPRPDIVRHLERVKAKAMSDFQAAITKIDAQIAQYTAIEG